MTNPIGTPSTQAAAPDRVPLGTMLVGLLLGAICFLRFRLDEAAHLAIRRELDARA